MACRNRRAFRDVGSALPAAVQRCRGLQNRGICVDHLQGQTAALGQMHLNNLKTRHIQPKRGEASKVAACETLCYITLDLQGMRRDKSPRYDGNPVVWDGDPLRRDCVYARRPFGATFLKGWT